MKFKYKKYSPQIIRPVIPIGISYENSFIQHEVLIDSGADRCIFDAEIGKILGIDIEKGKKDFVAGLSGKSEPYYIHPVVITVGGYNFSIEAGFKHGYIWPYSIVGQIGFFNNFITKFNYRKAEIELSPRTDIS